MSDFCSVLNEKRAKLLAFGYLRRKQKKYRIRIPTDLCRLFLQFYHDVIEWKFTDKTLTKFYDCSQRWLFQGEKFKINDISFKLTMCPRYRGWTFQTDGEYVALFFELDRKTFPEKIKNILVYFILYFEEFQYEYRHTTKLSKLNHDIMWYTPTVQYNHIKDQNFKQLNFGCYAEILRVEYNENAMDVDGDITDDTDDELIYSDGGMIKLSDHNMRNNTEKCTYFTMKTKILSQYCFRWTFNENERNRFKNAKTDYSLYSQNFNGGCFCIVCSPNGLTVVKDSDGLIFLKIKLLKLPCDVDRIQVEYELVLETRGPLHKFIHKDIREYAYDKTGDNVKDDFMKLSSMMDVKEIKITAKIKVLKVFDSENNEIKRRDWFKHGIIEWKL